MNVQPYLFFEGYCEEALDFYTKALGTRVDMLLRMSEAPDGRCSGQPKFDGFAVSITAADEIARGVTRHTDTSE